MPKKAAGRDIPSKIPGFKEIKHFEGAFANTPLVRKQKGSRTLPRLNKIVESLEQAILKSGLRDGMCVSFHHHLRDGDMVLNMVMDVIANLGIKNLTLASSSLTRAHNPLIRHIKNGVVSRLITSGLRDKLAEEVSHGLMETPVLFHTHGGRARMIESGELKVDIAFLGVPSSDVYGNANGYTGPSACGSLGYAMVDAEYAEKVVLITDNLVEYPNTPFSIHQDHVDYIVQVDQIGDPEGISSGALRMTRNPRDILIAEYATHVIEHSGYMEDGFSLQTGSGSISLAVSNFMRDVMLRKGYTASFALGGITGSIVRLHEEGLIKRLLDVQSFDQEAIRSIGENRYHTEIDASYYANPHNKGCATNKINVVILSAMEIDTDFNVNVLTGSDGVIRGASGGHSDTAIGAGISVIVAPLFRGRSATVVDRVNTVITPGETADVLVTDYGVAVNPRRRDIYDRLKTKHLPLYSIEELYQKAEKVTGRPEPVQFEKKIVGVVEYRDGTILDVIHQVKD
ncbi:MAG TPA: citrate lyase subunit alpha [Sediminispirochaeta sp.]|nr:citrate lyase subunit alpha [Sediminispirochaeta sp.]